MSRSLKGSVWGCAPSGEHLEQLKRSPQWQGGRFGNLVPSAVGSPGFDVLAEWITSRAPRKPPQPLPACDTTLEQLAAPPVTGLRVTWLGHSTLLLEIDGARILTDPVWGERASPLAAIAGPRRFHAPPLRFEDLPTLDAILWSHDHYDHLDLPTVKLLLQSQLADTPLIVPLGVGAHLRSWGVPAEQITELDWWQEHPLGGSAVRVTSTPSRHFSGRGLRNRNTTLWTGWAFRGPQHSVYFSGDSGPGPHFAEIAQRLGPFDLAFLEVGAWHPSWGDIHLGPMAALDALQALGAPPLLPIHWGTFDLALHAWYEPPETLLAEAARRGLRLLTPRLAEPVEPATAPPASPWWRAILPGGAAP